MVALRKQLVLAVVGAGIWMNLNEFIRNEILLKQNWIDGFKEIGLIFPSEPINGAIWGLWTMIFVVLLVWLITKFNVFTSAIITWGLGFLLLWLAMWNMGVLPGGILYWAVPWSFIEVYVAGLICAKLIHK